MATQNTSALEALKETRRLIELGNVRAEKLCTILKRSKYVTDEEADLVYADYLVYSSTLSSLVDKAYPLPKLDK